MNLCPRLVFVETRDGRLEYRLSFRFRACFFVATAGLGLAGAGLHASSFLSILAWCLALISLFLAIAEDRWSFFIAELPAAEGEEGEKKRVGGLNRSSGSFIAPHNFEFSLEQLDSIELRDLGPGEILRGIQDDRDPGQPRYLAADRGPWSALLMRLGDGRNFAITYSSSGNRDRLLAEGQRVSEYLGIQFFCTSSSHLTDASNSVHP